MNLFWNINNNLDARCFFFFLPMENLTIQNTMCQNVIFCLIYKFLCNLNDNLVYLIWNTFLYNSQVRKYGEILPYSEVNSLASLKRHFNGLSQKTKYCWVADKRLFYSRHSKQYELYVPPKHAHLICCQPSLTGMRCRGAQVNAEHAGRLRHNWRIKS